MNEREYQSTPEPILPTPLDPLREAVQTFDFRSHLARQAAFSLKTFGPGGRVKGVTDHIRKELDEVVKSNGSLDEWIDVVILGLDGCWRSGVTPEEIITALVAKQTKNEARTWPDWRTMSPDKAIEHDRTKNEKRSCESCKYAGFDIADGPYCAHPETLKSSPWGLNLSSPAIAKICPAPAHPNWVSKTALALPPSPPVAAPKGPGMVEWCREERAAGNGPCGACALCCGELRNELEKLRAAPVADPDIIPGRVVETTCGPVVVPDEPKGEVFDGTL